MIFLLHAKEYALKITILNKKLKNIYPIKAQKISNYPTGRSPGKVRKMDRLSLLRPTLKKSSNKIRLITNYNPMNPNLQEILKNLKDYC